MSALDLIVVLAYLGGIIAFGAHFSRAQRTVQDYFVSGKALPWWAIMGSIVATETSTVTFISIPGLAYVSNFTFLQLVLGYLLGRVVVAALLVPAYFRGDVLTAYELLGTRFTSLWKANFLLLPIIIVATVCFSSFIWRLEEIPSYVYPYTEQIWELEAKNACLVFSSTLGEYSPFSLEQMDNFGRTFTRLLRHGTNILSFQPDWAA